MASDFEQLLNFASAHFIHQHTDEFVDILRSMLASMGTFTSDETQAKCEKFIAVLSSPPQPSAQH